MAKGFKHGAGGGASLNFKVVGGTSAPSNPKENTIWVNTDTEITGWHFGAEDIFGQLDLTNSVNATNVVSGLSNGEIHFKNDLPPMWSSTYLAKCRLIAGVTYILAANLGYGRLNIVKDPSYYGDDATDFVEHHSLGRILFYGKNQVEITPIVTSDYYLSFCSDQGDANGAKPAFSTGILLYPKSMNVWIKTGAFSSVEFNALKKNGITVYPFSAKQYVNGALVDVEAKIYQNGVWTELWDGHLYRNGDEYDAVTGGWIPYKTSFPDTTAVEPKVTKNASSVKITITQSGSYGGALVTKNKVSFKGKKRLVFTGSSTGENNARCSIMIWSQMATNCDTNRVAIYNFPSYGITNSTVSLDVTNLEGEYYVGLYIYMTTHWIEMKEMKLE